MNDHLFIPDPQCAPGHSIDHLRALGNYIVEHQPSTIINIGDHADMPSLSSFEKKGSKYFFDKAYTSDIAASLAGMEALLGPIVDYNDKQKENHKARYRPRLVMCMGNHEERIIRAVKENPIYEGLMGVSDLKYEEWGWEVHPFLEIVVIDGIAYSHYFVNPDSLMGRPVAGTIENKLKLLGMSFTMGHQQVRQYGSKFTADGRELHGLVCGSFYLHDEDYLGPQKNRQHWRGFVHKHNVHDGVYDPHFISISSLLEDYL